MSELGILVVALIAFAVGYKCIAWIFDRRQGRQGAAGTSLPVGPVEGEADRPPAAAHEDPAVRYARVLGLPRSFTGPEITHRYETLLATYAPDRLGSLPPELRLRAEQKLREISEAYACFRAKYSLRAPS